MNIKSIKSFGVVGNVVLSSILLVIFYGTILKNANNTYFSASGDGLKSTFGSAYHLNYDTTYLRTAYMNYPFGESVFYTGGQPVIVNSFKLLKSIGIDLSSNLVGIINIWMLFSIALGALFIYLILRELNLPIIYSIVVSNIIIFMSPQLDRFGGHYNLAYLYFIPLMIYLFFLFYRKRKLYLSILLGLVALLSLGTHAYFFGFYAILLICFWVGAFLYDKKSFGNIKFILLNIFIQFILPFIIFQALMLLSGEMHDRTSYPWGFFSFIAYPQGIFYPLTRAYGKFIYVKQVPWEGISYIGLVSLIGFLFIIYNSVKKQRKDKAWNFLKITDSPYLNILFWSSFVALLYSFGMPFTLGLQKLFNHMGMLKQLRAPGRFAWLFFYTINITTFYLLWNYYKQGKKILALSILGFALIWGSYDSYLNVKSQPKFINNTIESLNDKENETEINQWYNEIDFEKYQAIIPLPYYHVGCENYSLYKGSASIGQSFITSMKTGLPLTSVMLSRTSMEQSVKNIQLFLEPYNSFDIIDLWPSEKPFLVLFTKKDFLDENERRIKNKAKLLTYNSEMEIREITIDDFKEILKETKEKVKTEIEFEELFDVDGFLSTDSIYNFYYESFGDKYSGESPLGENCYCGIITKQNLVLETKIANIDTTKNYIISLWVENMDRDLYPRTKLTVSIFNESGKKYYNNKIDIWRKTKIIDSNGWGLVEFEIEFKEPTGKLSISMKNKLMTKGELKVDEILIRPSGIDLYYKDADFIYKNNRFYIMH